MSNLACQPAAPTTNASSPGLGASPRPSAIPGTAQSIFLPSSGPLNPPSSASVPPFGPAIGPQPLTPVKAPLIAKNLILAPDTAELARQGASLQLKLIASDAAGLFIPLEQLELEWVSDNPGRFSVSNSGAVTALQTSGSGTITVRERRSGLSASSQLRMASPKSGGGGGGGGTSNPGPSVPVFSSFSPASGLAGTVVTITGTGLTGTTTVSFNGLSALVFAVVNDTTLTAVAPAGFTPGTISLTTAGGTATSGSVFQAAPSLSTMSTSLGTQAGGEVITLTGERLSATTAVTFNNIPATSFTVESDTQLTVTVPAGTGAAQIAVTTPVGTSLIEGYRYLSMTGFTPASAGAGASVTLSGIGFTGATGVSVNGVDVASFTVVSDTEISVTLPAQFTSGPIVVTSPVGSLSSSTLPSSPEFVSTVPSISGFTPAAASSGSTVTISGIRFTGATGVSFNGTSASSFNVVSDTEITAVVPAGLSPGGIAVTTANGSASSNASFSSGPLLTGFSPASGPAAGGTVVTITGSGFTDASAVNFNGSAAASFTVESDSQIKATTPAGLTSGSISIQTVIGTGSAATAFKAGPALTGFYPAEGPSAGGTSVTLYGSNFTGTTAVSFNGTPAQFTVNSNTELTAIQPAGILSGPITVTNAAGSISSTQANYYFTEPTLTSLSQTQGLPVGGNEIILNGKNFYAIQGVSFGGTPATNLIISSPTQLRVTVPAGTGSAPITVTSTIGTSNSLTYSYVPRIFVNANVIGGNNNGTTWANAYRDLQDALASATGKTEIWVANGTYKPAPPNGDRNATFKLRSHVSIYGGFNGTENSLDQRIPYTPGRFDPSYGDPETQVILSGDFNDSTGIDNDNSYHVVTGADDALLDGVIITKGYSEDSIIEHRVGVGGGMLNDGVSPRLNHVRFVDNFSDSYGGGMANLNGAAPIMTNVDFVRNHTRNKGGGIYNKDSTLDLSQVTLWSNDAGHSGGAIYSGDSTLRLKKVIIIDNSGEGYGGGGMIIVNGTLIGTNVYIVDNYTIGKGGGLFIDQNASVDLTNLVSSRNRAHNTYGSEIHMEYSSLRLNHATIVNNRHLYSDTSIGLFLVGSKRILNSLIYASAPNWSSQGNDSTTFDPTFSNVDVWGENGGNFVRNENGEPQFIFDQFPGGNDGLIFSNDDGLNLAPGENPAVDTGVASDPAVEFDILGNPRTVGAAPDRGAYERQN